MFGAVTYVVDKAEAYLATCLAHNDFRFHMYKEIH